MKIIMFLSVFMGLLFANNFTSLKQCSFESEKFWIKILYLCFEGDVACDKMIYIGVNKNNGDYVAIKGKTLLDKSGDFKGYSFKNGNYQYDIFKNKILYISKDGKLIQEIILKECQGQ